MSLLLVGGVRDLTVLFLTFTAQSATMACGHLTELLNRPQADPNNPNAPRKWPGSGKRCDLSRLAPFWVGCYIHGPTWVVFLFSFHDSVSKAKERFDREPPQWVYAIVWSQFLLFTSFTFPIAIYQLARPPRLYWQTELIYSVLSLVCKCVLNGLMLANVFIVGRLDLSND